MPVLHFQEVQALDRTQPGLPIIKGRAGTMTHDDKRMAPLPCLPAVDVARHRHLEFLRFLRTVHQQTPKGQRFSRSDFVLDELFEKLRTGQDVLAFTPRQLDEVLLSCFFAEGGQH